SVSQTDVCVAVRWSSGPAEAWLAPRNFTYLCWVLPTFAKHGFGGCYGRLDHRDGPSAAQETGDALQGVFQPLDGAQVTGARRRLLDPQRRSRLAVAQLLEVPERQDLAVDRVHGVEHLLEPNLQFGPPGRVCRRGEAPDQHRGQGDRRRLRQGA